MDFRKLVMESLSMLDKSDQGIIFQDIDNQVIHVADAAFFRKEAFSKRLAKAPAGEFFHVWISPTRFTIQKRTEGTARQIRIYLGAEAQEKTDHTGEDFGKIM